jgi:TRAP-type C4-dicarboxylate transport system permease small subunit
MQALQKAVLAVSRLAAWLSGLILIAMVVHILVEIVLRSFFDTSTYVLDEFIGYGVAAMTFLTLAFALEEGSLIRVNIVLSRTRGGVRRALEVVCASSTLVLACYLGWYVFRNWKRDWDRGAVSPSIAEVPMWIPEGLVLIGYALFVVQLTAYLLRLLSGGRPIGSREE